MIGIAMTQFGNTDAPAVENAVPLIEGERVRPRDLRVRLRYPPALGT